MRHAVIVKNPNGAKPEVQFFARLQDAKPVFKAAEIAEGDAIELWSATSGRIKRRKGRSVIDPVVEIESTEVSEDQPKARKGRNK